MAEETMLESLRNRLFDLDSIIQEQNDRRYNRLVNKTDTSEFVKSIKSDSKNKFWPVESSWMVARNQQGRRYLDLHLARLFSEYWKKHYKEYEPDTLKAYQASHHENMPI